MRPAATASTRRRPLPRRPLRYAQLLLCEALWRPSDNGVTTLQEGCDVASESHATASEGPAEEAEGVRVYKLDGAVGRLLELEEYDMVYRSNHGNDKDDDNKAEALD